MRQDGCGRSAAAGKKVSRVMFLLTDGIPNAFPKNGNGIESLLKEAGNVRANGITIVAVGVGKNVNFDILKQITANPALVYHKKNFHELTNSQFISNLVDPLCQDPVVIETFRGVTPKPKKSTKKPKTTQEKTTKKVTPKATTTKEKLTLPTNSTGACRCAGHREMQFPGLKLSVFDIEKYPGRFIMM